MILLVLPKIKSPLKMLHVVGGAFLPLFEGRQNHNPNQASYCAAETWQSALLHVFSFIVQTG